MKPNTSKSWSIALISPEGSVTPLANFTGVDTSGELRAGEDYVDFQEIERDIKQVLMPVVIKRTKAPAVDAKVAEPLLKVFVRGTTTHAHNCTVVALTATHMLVRVAGGSGWSGIGSQSYYPVEYKVVRRGCTLVGMNDNDTVASHEGRLSKDDHARLMEALAKA